MPKPFPQFDGPYPLSEERSWSAEFESYDMRMDAAYYFVTIRRGDVLTGEFFVRAPVHGGVPDEKRLFSTVERQAQAGVPNCEYTGGMMWELRRQREAAERQN